LPKPNYSFQKRQKELEKARKKEEKRQRKLDRAQGQPSEEPDELAPPADEPAV
jgi:hypothetical protein